jgi:hypothetical protein
VADPVSCAKVKSIAEENISNIRQKVKDLRRLERVLNAMVAQCRGDEMPDCPILEALTSPVLLED